MADVRIAISMGDPGGIGPECLAKALADPSVRARGRYVIVGSRELLESLGVRESETVEIDEGGIKWPSTARTEPNAESGDASFRAVERAIELVQHGQTQAICTMPISKEAWHLGGHTEYPGHTELLADRFGAARSAMMFWSEALVVTLATVHVPLAQVAGLVTRQRVGECIELTHESMSRSGEGDVVIYVAGLNPHAGEGGLLGSEDDAEIAPAVAEARERGLAVRGPMLRTRCSAR